MESRALREACLMPLREFADLVCVSPSTVSDWESRKEQAKIRPANQRRLEQLLAAAAEPVRARMQVALAEAQDEEVKRRRFIPVAALPFVGAAIAPFADMLAPLAARLVSLTPVQATPGLGISPRLSMDQAASIVGRAKRLYQECRYAETLQLLPHVLETLDVLTDATRGSERLQVHSLAADAYHVVGSVLLKLDDHTLAALAARRAMEEAQRSEDPVTVAGSTRIMVHALMASGHGIQAFELGAQAAAALRRHPRYPSPEGLSVCGALVLRAAVAAARVGDRSASAALLTEADSAANRLGLDANDRWTGFGPTNVQLHRVNIALALGDAGTAIELAQCVDIARVQLAERKAALLIDVAQAYAQWGKHLEALQALERVDNVAPEELRRRPVTKRICEDLVATARGPARDKAMLFARRFEDAK